MKNRNVRMDPAGPELQCPHCREFWPIDREWWYVERDGTLRANACRSCERERARLYQAMRRLDPTFVESERKRMRRRFRKDHPRLLEAYDLDARAKAQEYTRQWRARRVA